MEHPFVGGQHFGDRGQRDQRIGAVVHRIDQDGAGTLAADLHQIGAVGVAETGRPFRVDREGSVARGQKLCRLVDFVGCDR